MKKFTKQVQLFIARGGLVIMLALAVVMSTSAVNVRAGEDNQNTEENTTLKNDEIKDMFGGVSSDEKDVFSDVNKLASGTAKSALTVVRTVGAFVIVGGVLITALKLGTGNPQKRQQAKEELGWKIAAALLFLGGLAVLLFANKLASSIATALTTSN